MNIFIAKPKHGYHTLQELQRSKAAWSCCRTTHQPEQSLNPPHTTAVHGAEGSGRAETKMNKRGLCTVGKVQEVWSVDLKRGRGLEFNGGGDEDSWIGVEDAAGVALSRERGGRRRRRRQPREVWWFQHSVKLNWSGWAVEFCVRTETHTSPHWKWFFFLLHFQLKNDVPLSWHSTRMQDYMSLQLILQNLTLVVFCHLNSEFGLSAICLLMMQKLFQPRRVWLVHMGS